MKNNLSFIDDAKYKLQREFSHFPAEPLLVFSDITKKVKGQSYWEKTCWIDIITKNIYYYEFESFVTPGGYLSSSDYIVVKKSFSSLNDFYEWSCIDNPDVFRKAENIIISLSKNEMQEKLPEKSGKSIKAKI